MLWLFIIVLLYAYFVIDCIMMMMMMIISIMYIIIHSITNTIIDIARLIARALCNGRAAEPSTRASYLSRIPADPRAR